MTDAERPRLQRVPGAGDRAGDAEPAWRELRRAVTAEAFCRAWLDIQCRFVRGAAGGAVFLVQPAEPATTLSLSAAAIAGSGLGDKQSLIDAVRQALSKRRSVIVPRGTDPDAPPRSRFVIAYGVYAAGVPIAAVALDVRARSRAELRLVMRQLEWGAGWLEGIAPRRAAADRDAAGARLQDVLDVAASALHQERFVPAATALATALATKLGCDRVSVGVVRDGRVRVRAVSHTAELGHRTNLLRAIGGAMDEAIDEKHTIVYPPLPGAPARVVRAHQEAAEQAGAAILSVPLAHGARLVGVLTLERPAGRPFDQPTVEFAQAAAALAGPTLEALRREDRWLAAKAVETGREHLARLVGRGHVGLKLGVAATAVVLALLVFVKGEYRVAARAVMEAETRRVAVVPFNGYVREASARAGDLVRRGDLLAALDDRELRLERARWSGQLEQLGKVQNQALAARNAAQIAVATAQMDQARAQLALVDEHLARSRVVAPFDGVVVVGDLSQSLGAPVEKGQVLFQIAPLDAYRVVLEVDERDISDVAVGQRGRLLLAAAPATSLAFSVQQITPVSTAREGRNYFRVEAKLDDPPARLRPGMEGVGKVSAGTRPLVAVWTRSLVDWIQLVSWTWTP